jgi:hypothetical protein
MKNILVILTILLTSISVHAKNVQSQITQTEVYIWGSIFFSIAMGSLLLVVYLFPKSDAYKRQVSLRNTAMKSGLKQPSETSKTNEIHTSTDITVANPTISKSLPNTEPLSSTQTAMETSPTAKPVDRTESYTQSPTLKPRAESNTNKSSIEKSPKTLCKLMNYDQVFSTKHLDVENISKEFLSKINEIHKCKSISIYFLKKNQFVRFIELTKDQFSSYDSSNEKKDITEDVIDFLKKRLGAFSSTHSDAVLPMVSNDQLFGAIKLEFYEPSKNLDINPIWSEIKTFSKYYFQTFLTQPNQMDPDISVYNIDHFINIINYRVTLEIPQNLTMIKVLNFKDVNLVFHELGSILKNIIDKKPEIYKISSDTAAIFISIESREKLSKSIPELLTTLKKNFKSIDINIGSADYHSSFKFPQKWQDKAKNALNDSVSEGLNKFILYKEN